MKGNLSSYNTLSNDGFSNITITQITNNNFKNTSVSNEGVNNSSNSYLVAVSNSVKTDSN